MNPPPSAAEPAALARRDGSSIRVLAASYGRFPQADELNPEFQTDSPRLKLSLEVHAPEGFHPEAALEKLRELLPGLDRHQCCGGQGIGRSLFQRETGRDAAIREVEGSADLAHLVEHVVIELQARVGGVSRASGVTCGHWEPPSRYDLFVESPDPLCAGITSRLAVTILNDQLDGAPRTAVYRVGIPATARLYACRPWPRTLGELSRQPGETTEALGEAVRHLVDQGVLAPMPMTVDLNGEACFGLGGPLPVESLEIGRRPLRSDGLRPERILDTS